MKIYEAVVIYSPQLTEVLQQGKSIFEAAVQKLGGKVLHVTDLGKRYLSYSVKKFKEGYGCVFDFELKPDQVQALKHALQLTDSILKFIVVVKPKATSVRPMAAAYVRRDAIQSVSPKFPRSEPAHTRGS